jgi:hypothetical protein
MAFIPVVNVAEVVLGCSVNSQDVFTVHNFLFPGAITAGDLDDLAVTVANAWGAELAPLLSVAITLNFVRCTDLTTVSAPVREFFPSTNNVGEVGANPLSNNSALVVSYQTANRGKSFRGRTYQGGLPVTAAGNAITVTGSFQLALAAAMTGFMDDIEVGQGVTQVIVSRVSNKVPRSSGLATPVTTMSVNTALDSMRSRLEGRGQ